MDFLFAVGGEHFHEFSADQQPRFVAGHGEFNAQAPRVNHGIGVGRFQNVFVFSGDHFIKLDEHALWTIGFGVVSKEPLTQLDVAVIDGGEAVVNDVANARWVFNVQPSGKRQEVSVSHVPCGDGVGDTTDLLKSLGVGCRHHGLRIKTALGVHELVAAGLGVGRNAKGGAMHKAEMRVVKRVLQGPHGRRGPGFIKLIDGSKATRAKFGDGGNLRERLTQTDPSIAVAAQAVVTRGFVLLWNALTLLPLGDVHHHPSSVVAPAVVGALQCALFDPALGELGRAVATAVSQGRRLASCIQKEHDVFAQQTKWLGAIAQMGQGHHRMPEISENGLLGGEHVVSLLVLKAPTQDSFLHAIIASLSCHLQGDHGLEFSLYGPVVRVRILLVNNAFNSVGVTILVHCCFHWSLIFRRRS